MQVTDEMIRQAMKKAIEAGLLPRDALTSDTMGSQDLIREILQGALDVAAHEPAPPSQKNLPQ